MFSYPFLTLIESYWIGGSSHYELHSHRTRRNLNGDVENFGCELSAVNIFHLADKLPQLYLIADFDDLLFVLSRFLNKKYHYIGDIVEKGADGSSFGIFREHQTTTGTFRHGLATLHKLCRL